MQCSLVIEGKDVFTFSACTWFIGKVQGDAFTEASISVWNSRDDATCKTVLFARAGYGTVNALDYCIEESETPYPTDGKPEKYRRLVLHGSSIPDLTQFVQTALREYRAMVESAKCPSGGLRTHSFDGEAWLPGRPVPMRPSHTLFLPGTTCDAVLADVTRFLAAESTARYKALHIPMVRIYMLHGVPGSGKSSLATCIASECGVSLAKFSGGDIDSFAYALECLPANSMLLIDDIDCMLREQRNESGFQAMLDALDGVSRTDPLIICFTTNLPGCLDVALRRRVDYAIEFKHAVRDQCRRMCAFMFPNTNFDEVWSRALTCSDPFSTSTFHKFLVRALSSDPLTLLDGDPEAFRSLCSLTAPATRHHLYS